jgi:hypothetical protein
VPAYNTNSSGVVSGIWKFQLEAGFDFSGAVTNIFRYDHNATGGREAEFSLWHHEGRKWIDVATKPGYTVSVNTNAGVKRLTVSGFTDTNSISGFFAIGAGVQPSPAGSMLTLK